MNTTTLNQTAVVFTVTPTKCLTKKQLDNRIKKLEELELQTKELKKAADALKEEIIAGLSQEHTTTANYKINYTAFSQKRIDTKSLKAELPEIAEQYAKETITHRFTYKRI